MQDQVKFGEPYRPKRGEQVEVGVKWSPADRPIIAQAAVYELKEKNRLTTDPTNPSNQVQRGDVTVRGAEMDGTVRFNSLDLVASYRYTDATTTSSADPADPNLDKRLASIPEHAASLSAVYRFGPSALAGLSAGTGVRYVGETWAGLDQLATPSNTLYDAMISFDQGPWRFALNVTNLTDEDYVVTYLDRGDCWYGSRRETVASFGCQW